MLLPSALISWISCPLLLSRYFMSPHHQCPGIRSASLHTTAQAGAMPLYTPAVSSPRLSACPPGRSARIGLQPSHGPLPAPSYGVNVPLLSIPAPLWVLAPPSRGTQTICESSTQPSNATRSPAAAAAARLVTSAPSRAIYIRPIGFHS